ncbi:subtilisin-like serine protease [Tulasnella sp. 403]|nr:subtilisin-like serine protease [Tulasnella sp. 403]
MRYFGISLVVLAVSLGSLADSPSLTVQTVQGDVVPGSYIVKLKDGSNKATLIDTLQQKLASKFHLTHDYDPQFFNAFSGQLSPEAIQELSSDKNVEYITEDAIVHALGTQTNAPWGLQRISHRGPLPIGSNPNTLSYRYEYPDKAGSGVNVYIVDTGINTQHVNFGGRATFGYTTVDSKEDGNGHGTHCAGTAVGSLYGIARNAKVIAVKVLSDQGSGSTSGIIAGIDWVVKQYRQNRVPSVMSLSLGGARNIPLDHAVTCAVNAGVHTTVAAGNSNDDASKYSPAGAPKVITVGATTIADPSDSSVATTISSQVLVFIDDQDKPANIPDYETIIRQHFTLGPRQATATNISGVRIALENKSDHDVSNIWVKAGYNVTMGEARTQRFVAQYLESNNNPAILSATGRRGRVDFSAELANYGLLLCVSDLKRVNFMRDSDGRIVAVDFGGYSFLPPSFFAFALGHGSLAHRISTMLEYPSSPSTHVAALVSASCALVPYGTNDIGE